MGESFSPLGNFFQNLSTIKYDHAIFRNPLDLHENPLEIVGLGNDEEQDNSQLLLPDIIEPLLPPHINYDKVNKYLANDTSDIFNAFHFYPSFANILLLIGLSMFTLWVIVMNILIIIGLWRTHRNGHMADLYLANLAIGDTLLGIFILPLMSVVILIGYFPFTRFVCDISVFLDYYLIVSTSFGSCALMCNYLWMMKWPETFPVDSKHHILAITLCWVAVNLSWTPSFFNDRLSVFYPLGQCGFSISRNQYFSFYIGMSGFYIPLAVSLICGIWSLAGLKQMSGIPLLSWRQSLSVGRRRRSSTLVSEVVWSFFKLLPDTIINSLDEEDEKAREKFKGRPPAKYYGPGAPQQKPSQLRHLKQRSITSSTDPKIITQIAKDHYPLVVSSLVLFIVCRSLFYVYFGVGSFVPNFFPLDLSNGVYWLMHSNAALSPLIHFAFDPELREEIGNMFGLQRNAQKSAIVHPEVTISSVIPSPQKPNVKKERFERSKYNRKNVRKDSPISSFSHFSVRVNSDDADSPPTTKTTITSDDMYIIPPFRSPSRVCFENEQQQHPRGHRSIEQSVLTAIDVNKKPQFADRMHSNGWRKDEFSNRRNFS